MSVQRDRHVEEQPAPNGGDPDRKDSIKGCLRGMRLGPLLLGPFFCGLAWACAAAAEFADATRWPLNLGLLLTFVNLLAWLVGSRMLTRTRRARHYFCLGVLNMLILGWLVLIAGWAPFVAATRAQSSLGLALLWVLVNAVTAGIAEWRVRTWVWREATHRSRGKIDLRKAIFWPDRPLAEPDLPAVLKGAVLIGCGPAATGVVVVVMLNAFRHFRVPSDIRGLAASAMAFLGAVLFSYLGWVFLAVLARIVLWERRNGKAIVAP